MLGPGTFSYELSVGRRFNSGINTAKSMGLRPDDLRFRELPLRHLPASPLNLRNRIRFWYSFWGAGHRDIISKIRQCMRRLVRRQSQ